MAMNYSFLEKQVNSHSVKLFFYSVKLVRTMSLPLEK